MTRRLLIILAAAAALAGCAPADRCDPGTDLECARALFPTATPTP